MKKLSLLFTVMVFVSSAVLSQFKIKPVKFENITWHRIMLINYKPGQVPRAKEIIKQYQTAGDAANLKGPVTYRKEI